MSPEKEEGGEVPPGTPVSRSVVVVANVWDLMNSAATLIAQRGFVRSDPLSREALWDPIPYKVSYMGL